ncbi:tetratricopeptide repeat protein [Cryomorpha ignava]|uniref:histidine kinase n=1 Tax=Cryomorpha ignava TaxID=101383 RepID=A0A7K3WTL0_9FLAO|nr:tetratricopeptide repeat protein [Cryomorpha ignava]NEN25027.1 tetratricopeptide repeat protein [Cryomorpha ignava]
MRALFKSLIILACGLFFNHLSAQPQAVKDKYQQLLKEAKSENERIDVVNFMVDYLKAINVDSSLALALVNIEDAKKAGYLKGEYWATKYASTSLINKGAYVSAKKYLNEASEIANQFGDSALISNYFSGMGMYYGVQSMYDSSAVYYKKSIAIDEARKGDKISPAYEMLAISYQMQSDFAQAIFYQQKALNNAENLKNDRDKANILVNMGNTYRNIGDTVRSEQAFLEAIELAKELNEKRIEMYGYSNIANLYFENKKYDKAYANSMLAVEMAEQAGEVSIGAASLSKAAQARMMQLKYREAEDLAILSISLADSSHQPLTIYQTLSTLGNIYVAQEKYKKAIPILKRSLESKKEAGFYDTGLAQLYKDLSLSYEKTGRYDEALLNYKIGVQIVDSVRRNENIRKATELTMTYDFDKEKAANQVIQAKKDAAEKTRQLLLGSGLLIALIIATGGWISYRNKQKANSLLEQRKNELESTLTKLKKTQTQLIQSEKMASLGELTAGIAHEIQNPLNFVNNFSELSNELIDELEEERAKDVKEKDDSLISELLGEIKQNLTKIHHHGQRADGIVKGMLQHSRKNTGEKFPTDVNKLTDEFLRLAYHGFRAKDKQFNAQLQTDFDPGLNILKLVPEDIGRVLLNLMTNAFYAINQKKQMNSTDYEPTIWVSTKLSGEKICISVRDNGNGISENALGKIFQPFFTTKPTGEGTGLGLSMSYDIVKSHGGELKVETEEGEGTTFTIELSDFD